MSEITTIGLDLAKSVFQVHGVNDADGGVTRKRLRRGQMLTFFAGLPPCLVGMEACATAHYWARELRALGHEVRLMPPQYVKAYLKRNKNDAADAEAICEAVRRPSMRFVPVKTKEQQSALLMHRGRELLVRQRTMLANALRGHLAEFGFIAAQGLHKLAGLIAIIRNDEDERVPDMARQVLRVIADGIGALDTQITILEVQIMAWHRSNPVERASGDHPWDRADHRPNREKPALRRRSQSPVSSTVAGSSPHGSVSCRDRTPLAAKRAWAGSANAATLTLRRLLVNGAHAALLRSKAAKADPWLIALCGRRPRLVVAVALANKTARIAWALMTKQGSCRFAAAAA
jgi:transposase